MTADGHSAREALRALIVEHDSADVELCLAALARDGFEVVSAVVNERTGFEREIASRTFDLVLADYTLPAWCGLESVEVLAEHGLDVPVILVTGTLGEERAVDCLKRGAADYVLKGNLARLGLAVRRALEDRRTRARNAEQEAMIRKLSLAVDQSPASVIITDPSGTIEYVNQRLLDITGYARHEVLGRNPSMLQSGETPGTVYADLWSTIKAGRIWTGEILNRRKDGTTYWDAVRISPIRNDAGTITHFIANQEDLTARVEAERELREREERLRQIADNMQEVFFLVDVATDRVILVNRAFETVWGRPVESVYANRRSLIDAVVPEDRDAFAERMRESNAGVAGEVEYRIVRPDGTVRRLLTRSMPVRAPDGTVVRVIGVAQDVTERLEAQEALAESETRFRKLVEASFGGINISVDGVIRDASPGFAEMLGYSLDDIIGRPVIDFVADESKEDVARRIARGDEGAYEYVGLRADGRHIAVEVTTRNHEIDGRPGRVTALRDVTEKRQLEEQFRQAQKMEAVGRLAGGVAHDFNNLLTVISGHVELMLDELPVNDPRGDDLRDIQRAAHSAAGLTRQLLAFSRQQVVEPRLLVLEDAVDAASKMLRRVIGEDVRLQLHLNTQTSTIRIDPGQLDQVILNLAVNARDAMLDGGELSIETGVAQFDEAYTDAHWPARAGTFALLAISDTGTGMTEEIRARIFEPFFTTKGLGKGTGLGLATVYGIVKQSDGFIWVYSEPGHGSTFKVYLPVVAGQSEPAAIGGGIGDAPRGTEAILLAEDSASVRNATKRMLERFGYSVIEAPDGASALAIARRHGADIRLLLTDVVMPEMSGAELARAFAALRPDAKVLFMSGYTDDSVIRHGEITSGGHYIQKPFSPSALARKVRAILDE